MTAIATARSAVSTAAQKVRDDVDAASYVPEHLLAALTTDGISAGERQQISDIYYQLLRDLPNNGRGFKEVERLYTECENLVGLQSANATTDAIAKFFKQLFE